MNRIAKLWLGSALFGSMLMGAGWTGTLVDASCKEAHKDQACPVTKDTARLGLVSGGKYYAFVDDSQPEVLAALVKRQKDTGTYPEGTDVKVWVNGDSRDNQITMQRIEFK